MEMTPRLQRQLDEMGRTALREQAEWREWLRVHGLRRKVPPTLAIPTGYRRPPIVSGPNGLEAEFYRSTDGRLACRIVPV